MANKYIKFSKYNPSGNMTVLVHSSHDRSEYGYIAEQMMQTSHICCEQVGFIESESCDRDRPFHLVMSGNEFCGNATISFMHYLKSNHLINEQAVVDQSLQVQVSGCSELVTCKIHDNDCYEVMMPQPRSVIQEQLRLCDTSITVTKIIYESYLHFVVPVDCVTRSLQKEVEKFVRETEWQSEFKTIGIMLFNKCSQTLSPLIYIPELQSAIWENSCGSGTASIGIFKSYSETSDCDSLVVHQPGGDIIVTTKLDGKSYITTITGTVATVATGTAYIE